MLNQFFDKFIFTNGIKYKHSNFFLHEIPFLIMPVDLMIGIVGNENEEFQRELYYSVKESVKKNLVKRFGINFKFDEKQKFVQFLEKFFVASGWGDIHNVDIDFEKKRALLNLNHNPFSSHVKPKPKNPADHLMRGILAGIFSFAFDSDIECVEVECLIKGDNRCEFVLQRPKELDLEKETTRRQIRLKI